MQKSAKLEYIIWLISAMCLTYLLMRILFFSVNIWDKDFSKLSINKYIPEKNKLKTYLLNDINLSRLSYPYIIKPTKCSGLSRNVAIINNIDDLNSYKKNKKETYIIQEYYKSKNEIGVLYEKVPHINDGNVISIVLKQNNSNVWKPLKCGNITNNETTTCNDLTKELELSNFVNVIKEISSKIPDFNAGRYDIGFENIEELNEGNFKIYELNGVMGFDLRTNAYGNENLTEVCMKICYILRWVSVRCLIGLCNIVSFNVSPRFIINSYINSVYYYNQCSDWEYLFQPTPC